MTLAIAVVRKPFGIWWDVILSIPILLAYRYHGKQRGSRRLHTCNDAGVLWCRRSRLMLELSSEHGSGT